MGIGLEVPGAFSFDLTRLCFYDQKWACPVHFAKDLSLPAHHTAASIHQPNFDMYNASNEHKNTIINQSTQYSTQTINLCSATQLGALLFLHK